MRASPRSILSDSLTSAQSHDVIPSVLTLALFPFSGFYPLHIQSGIQSGGALPNSFSGLAGLGSFPLTLGLRARHWRHICKRFSLGYCVVFSVALSCLSAELVSELRLCPRFTYSSVVVPFHVLRLVTAIGALVQSFWQGLCPNSEGLCPKI